MNQYTTTDYVRADCEEMFFALGVDDPEMGAKLAKRAVDQMYKNEKRLHERYKTDTENLLTKSQNDRHFKYFTVPLDARIKRHESEIRTMNQKLEILQLL